VKLKLCIIDYETQILYHQWGIENCKCRGMNQKSWIVDYQCRLMNHNLYISNYESWIMNLASSILNRESLSAAPGPASGGFVFSKTRLPENDGQSIIWKNICVYNFAHRFWHKIVTGPRCSLKPFHGISTWMVEPFYIEYGGTISFGVAWGIHKS
jgi:hypothetical protein